MRSGHTANATAVRRPRQRTVVRFAGVGEFYEVYGRNIAQVDPRRPRLAGDDAGLWPASTVTDAA